MDTTTLVSRSRRAATLATITTLACGTELGPTQLAFRLDAEQATSFVATLGHSMSFEMGDHAGEGTREIRIAYTLRHDPDGEGTELRGTVTLDSVRASLIWGQQQQRIDTRHLVGRVHSLTYSSAGGAPAYGDEVPLIDMGGMGGGTLPTSLLFDYAFPTLSPEPVAVGDTWTETRTGRRPEATMWVSAEVHTTHRVSGTEIVDGTRCVAIESESTGTLSDGLAHDADVPFSGQLHGTATWCFDPESGALVRLIGEETTSGATQSPEGVGVTVEQTTRIEIHSVTAAGAGTP